MQRLKFIYILMIVLSIVLSSRVQAEKKRLSPSEIIANAPDHDWQYLDPENTLYLVLERGTVVIALNTFLAPEHVNNIKKLAREGFYRGLNIYRFVEGFVAQGGDVKEVRKPKVGKLNLKAEFYKQTDKQLAITLVDDKDGYAARTGFLNEFAVAQNSEATQTWQAHCPGVFAMARSESADSAGTEFYVALGTLRYLDRNITTIGRVISGMEFIQKLERNQKDKSDAAFKNYNVIKDLQVASDHLSKQALNIQVMKTNSPSFKALIESRRNRPSSWFVETPNYTDVCAVNIPSR